MFHHSLAELLNNVPAAARMYIEGNLNRLPGIQGQQVGLPAILGRTEREMEYTPQPQQQMPALEFHTQKPSIPVHANHSEHQETAHTPILTPVGYMGFTQYLLFVGRMENGMLAPHALNILANQFCGGAPPTPTGSSFRDATLSALYEIYAKCLQIEIPPTLPVTPVNNPEARATHSYENAVQHYRQSTICQNPLVKIKLTRLQLFFHPRQSNDIPQKVMERMPSAEWLYKNYKKQSGNADRKKFRDLPEAEQRGWNNLREQVKEERVLQKQRGYIFF